MNLFTDIPSFVKNAYRFLGYNQPYELIETILNGFGFFILFVTLVVLIVQAYIYRKQLTSSYRPLLVTKTNQFYLYWIKTELRDIPLLWTSEPVINGNPSLYSIAEKQGCINNKYHEDSLPFPFPSVMKDIFFEITNIGFGAATEIYVDFYTYQNKMEDKYLESIKNIEEDKNIIKLDFFKKGVLLGEMGRRFPLYESRYIGFLQQKEEFKLEIPPFYMMLCNIIFHNQKCKKYFSGIDIPPLIMEIIYNDIANTQRKKKYTYFQNLNKSSMELS